jgi:pyrroloquinoline quinone biosynthesis protein E
VARADAAIVAARERLRGRLVIDHVAADHHARYPKACMGGWGRRFLVVTPDGVILPCHGAGSIRGLEPPRVREGTLAAAWNDSEAFRMFRGTSWMREPCRSCDRREIDWGGCRCQALALTGDAAAADPVCARSPLHAGLGLIVAAESGAPPPPFRYRAPAPR